MHRCRLIAVFACRSSLNRVTISNVEHSSNCIPGVKIMYISLRLPSVLKYPNLSRSMRIDKDKRLHPYSNKQLTFSVQAFKISLKIFYQSLENTGVWFPSGLHRVTSIMRLRSFEVPVEPTSASHGRQLKP